jgi:hypothetical protein
VERSKKDEETLFGIRIDLLHIGAAVFHSSDVFLQQEKDRQNK